MATEHTLHGAQVKTRHPFAPLGLGLLTLGIYVFFWYYTINREMRDLGEDVKPGRALLAITLGALVVVPAVMSIYNTAGRIARVQERAGIPKPINPLLAVLMQVIPIANLFQLYYLQSGLNSAYEAMAGTAQVAPALGASMPGVPSVEPAV